MSAQHSHHYRYPLPETPLRGNLVLPEFQAEYAEHPGSLTLRYTSIGDASQAAVVVLGGVSANADIVTRVDGKPGWWQRQAGPGRAIDTDRFRVIGMDFITGNGIHGANCRHVTTRDQANALLALLNGLHVSRLHALVGASYGAMVGLAFAARYPERLERLVAISGAHCAHPRATAIRSIQRRILELAGAQGKHRDGVALARALALVSYREHGEFAGRFDGTACHTESGFRFPVENYLEYNGDRHAASISAADYRQLSESLDLHDVEPETVTTPATLIAADPDFLVPVSQMQELTERLGGPASLHLLRTQYGHDAFLKEHAGIDRILRDALAQGGAA